MASFACAITLARNNKKVTILEKNDSVLKKLLLTGNGKCNYFNSNNNISKYHTSTNVSLDLFINEERLNKVLNFFDSIGLISQIRDGYYYPYSNQAIGVKAAILNEAINLGVEIILNCKVKDIKINDNNFVINTNLGDFKGDKVIIATGGKSYPKTGSNGDFNDVIKSLDINIVKQLPSLVQLVGEGNFKDWEKIRTFAKLSLYEENNLKKIEIGEVQLTDYGISGICAFNLSSIITRGLYKNKKEIIKINFLPDLEIDIKTFIDERNNKLKNRTISELFEGILNYKLVYYLLKRSDISSKSYWNDISENKKKILCDNLINYELIVVDTLGFDTAQVTSGGVSLEEVKNNFESLKIDNLYFIGEVLDIDGDCGGYNLTFAFLSGIVVGEVC